LLPIAEHLYGCDETIPLPKRPDARANQKQGQRDDQRGRRRHQPKCHYAIVEGVAGRAENRERRHVGSKQGQQKHVRTQRAVCKKVIFGFLTSSRFPKREDADVKNNREVEEYKNRWYQAVSSPSPLVFLARSLSLAASLSSSPSSSSEGHEYRTRIANTSATINV